MRIVIGAPHGKSGKTFITMAVVQAMQKRGMKVAVYKKGPDFIDAGWLSLAAKQTCRNLDLFFLPPMALNDHFLKTSAGNDIAVVEGAMGLYDGLDLEGSDSTAALAKTLKAPVILVVDVTRMTRSVAALVKGFMDFDSQIRIAGVILNQVARPRHEDMLRRSIEVYCGIPVLGAVPRHPGLAIPQRHLGLTPAREYDKKEELFRSIKEEVASWLDVDRIIDVAKESPPLESIKEVPVKKEAKVRVGVVKDDCFTFYYPENLESLERAGADLVTIDAISSEKLPDIDALYIGGGFPEVFAEELEANSSLRLDIRKAAQNGMPIYAECGGLMYLARGIIGPTVRREMVGVLSCDVAMHSKPQGHGYTVLQVERSNWLFSGKHEIRGHEFHYSKVCNLSKRLVDYLFRVKRGTGLDGQHDGLMVYNTIATYNHVYAPACPEWAENLVAAAEGRQTIQGKNCSIQL